MPIESVSKMVFDADASGVERAYDKMTDGNKQYTQATLDGMRKASTAIREVTDQLQQNNVATRKLIEDNDNLKKKLAELKEQNEGFSGSLKDAKDAMTALGLTFGVSQIFSAIQEYRQAQHEWNEEIVKTQVEMDKVARQFQVLALMKDKSFQTLYNQQIVPMANQLNVSAMKTFLPTMMAAREMGVGEKDLAAVTSQGIRSAQAAGLTEGESGDFVQALLSRMASDKKEMTPENLLASSLPLINARRGMGIGGDKLLQLQRRAAEFHEEYGTPEDVTLALLQTLGRTGPGQMDPKRAMMAVQGVEKSLYDIKTKGQDALGEDLASEMQKQARSGNQLGALAQLQSSFQEKGLTDQQQAHVLSQVFGSKIAPQAQLLMKNLPTIMSTMASYGDQSAYQEGVGIAEGDSPTRSATIAENLNQQTKYNQDSLAERNRTLMELAKAEMGKAKYGLSPLRRKFMQSGEGIPLVGGAWDFMVSASLQSNADQGRDLEQEFQGLATGAPRWDRTTGNDFYGPREIWQNVLKTYREQVKQGGQAPSMSLPETELPEVAPRSIPRAFKQAPEDEEIQKLKTELLEGLKKLDELRMSYSIHPLSGQAVHTQKEEQLIKAQQQTNEHLQTLITLTKGKKEERIRDKNGANN